MGLKFFGILYKSGIKNEDVTAALHPFIMKKEYEIFRIPVPKRNKIMSIKGNKLLKFGHTDEKYGIKVLFAASYVDLGFAIRNDLVAQKLSESFKDTPFALIRYHSGNETGMTEIYLNGTIISSVYGEEGDELRPALKPLNEFLHLKIKDVYNMLDHYANEIDLYSPYSISGFKFLEHTVHNDNSDPFYTTQYEMFKFLIKNPEVTEEEWNKKYPDSFPLAFIKPYYINWLNVMKGNNVSEIYTLTEGLKPGKCFYCHKPKYLTPEEFFSLRDDYMEYERSKGKGTT
jgi:hypothetical protein